MPLKPTPGALGGSSTFSEHWRAIASRGLEKYLDGILFGFGFGTAFFVLSRFA